MRLSIISFILAVIAYLPLRADNYGVLQGAVHNVDGEPVYNAEISINNTDYRVHSDKKGQFSILDVVSGTYTIRVASSKYRAVEKEVRISTGEITELFVNLSASKADPLVRAYSSNDINNKFSNPAVEKIEAGELHRYPINSIGAAIPLSPGVISYINSFPARGSRPGTKKIFVDGIEVSDINFGSIGYDNAYISNLAVEEMQVIRGAYSAEYGNSMGGIINIIQKDGVNETQSVFMQYSTDLQGLNGSSPGTVSIIQNESGTPELSESGDGAKYLGPGLTKVDYGMGFKLPYRNSSLYFSAYYINEDYFNHSYDFKDPAGNSLGQLPDNQMWAKNLTGKFKIGLNDRIDLIVGGSHAMANYESMGYSWLYANEKGLTFDAEGNITGDNNTPEYEAKTPAVNYLTAYLYGRINFKLSDNQLLEFKIANVTQNSQAGRRSEYKDPMYFSGYSFVEPEDKYMVSGSFLVPGSDGIIDDYTELSEYRASDDGYIMANFKKRNPLSGYYEGAANYSGTDNPWGLDNTIVTHGNTRPIDFNNLNYWQIDAKYTLNLMGKIRQLIKTGFETRFYKIHRYYSSNPWKLDIIDMYTDEYSDMYGQYADIFNEPKSPYTFSFFASDIIQYDNFIIRPDIMIDYFNANDYKKFDGSLAFYDVEKLYEQDETLLNFSFNLGFTYSILDNLFLSIDAGAFNDIPELNNFYKYPYSLSGALHNNYYGNSELEAEHSVQYQASVNWELYDLYGISLCGFTNRYSNLVAMAYIPELMPYYVMLNDTESEYKSKGVEFSLRKRPGLNDHFGMRFNYAYTDTYLLADYDYTDSYNEESIRMDWDMRHKLNFIMDFNWGDNEGPELFGVHPLQNMFIDLATYFYSGFPYTRMNSAGNAIGSVNGEEHNSYWQTNLRFSKSILSSDIFGEPKMFKSIELYIDIYNLFNLTKPIRYYARTGDALDGGTLGQVTVEDFSSTVYYKEANEGAPESFKPDQYDDYGGRKYSAAADIDNDGKVVQEEKYQAYLKQLTSVYNYWSNYQLPRSVYFGIRINL